MSESTMTLRQRKQSAAMQRIQEAAFTMLAERGYEATKVTDIAHAAEVSPSSVYRYFGTKDGVFVWDPLEGPFMDLLEVNLGGRPAMEAVEVTFLAVVGDLSPGDEAVLRARTQAILATPLLREAMRAMLGGVGDDLGSSLLRGGADPLEARVVAAATGAVLLAAVEHWARPGSTDTLAEVTIEVFRSLRVAAI